MKLIQASCSEAQFKNETKKSGSSLDNQVVAMPARVSNSRSPTLLLIDTAANVYT